jgi:mycofactocin system creatininase family protein
MLASCDGAKPELIERRQVIVARNASFGSGHDGAIDRSRKSLLRASLGDSNSFKPRISHLESLGVEGPVSGTQLAHPWRPASVRSVELAKQAWPQVDGGSVLLFPLGSTEQHGPHLPMDTDARIAEAVARGAADATGATMAPVLPYGASGEHQGFAGTLSIGTEALHLVLVELVRSAASTFERVVLVNGHGGNIDGVTRAVTQLQAEDHDVNLWSPSLPGGDAHAGRTETSLMLAIALDTVELDAAEPGSTAPLRDIIKELRSGGIAAVSPNGILGDPTGATAAEGEQLLTALVAQLVAALVR